MTWREISLTSYRQISRMKSHHRSEKVSVATLSAHSTLPHVAIGRSRFHCFLLLHRTSLSTIPSTVHVARRCVSRAVTSNPAACFRVADKVCHRMQPFQPSFVPLPWDGSPTHPIFKLHFSPTITRTFHPSLPLLSPPFLTATDSPYVKNLSSFSPPLPPSVSLGTFSHGCTLRDPF
ncbi:hypothetical protein BC826DRAFT_738227 [Russula brevipes]|nr:hypothetical protein BC826DRAFT_738227 [Russula brevipes]